MEEGQKLASQAEFIPAARSSTGRAAPHSPAGVLSCVPWQGMASTCEAWDALARNASEPNPFFESWFLLPSLEAFDPQGHIRLLRFEAAGTLKGLMPLSRAGRYYHLPLPNLSNWLHANCFLGAPLVARGYEEAFWEALFAWADRNAGMALFLHLSHLPLTGALQEALSTVLTRQKRHHALVHREERAMLESALSAEAYLENALSGKKRKELRRQYNRLCEEGEVALERRNDTAELDPWIDAFLALEAAGWKGKAGSALACSPAAQALFRKSLNGAATQGRLERLQLTLDGKPIAMLATFLSPPGAFSFKTAFDEGFSRFSPGVLLQRENLALLERPGIVWTDSCAAADHPMIDHLWRERRPIGRISIAIGGPLRRAAFRQIARAETARNPELQAMSPAAQD